MENYMKDMSAQILAANNAIQSAELEIGDQVAQAAVRDFDFSKYLAIPYTSPYKNLQPQPEMEIGDKMAAIQTAKPVAADLTFKKVNYEEYIAEELRTYHETPLDGVIFPKADNAYEARLADEYLEDTQPDEYKKRVAINDWRITQRLELCMGRPIGYDPPFPETYYVKTDPSDVDFQSHEFIDAAAEIADEEFDALCEDMYGGGESKNIELAEDIHEGNGSKVVELAEDMCAGGEGKDIDLAEDMFGGSGSKGVELAEDSGDEGSVDMVLDGPSSDVEMAQASDDEGSVDMVLVGRSSDTEVAQGSDDDDAGSVDMILVPDSGDEDVEMKERSSSESSSDGNTNPDKWFRNIFKK